MVFLRCLGDTSNGAFDSQSLDWRMRSITPFLFIGLFESLFELKDPPLAQALKEKVINIIFQAHDEMEINETSKSIVDMVSSSDTRTPVSVSDCHYTKSEIESTKTTMVVAIATVPEKKDMKCSHKLIGFVVKVKG
ncbi:hypothetical protein V6N13_148117 [Hibiscus sabdariffa]